MIKDVKMNHVINVYMSQLLLEIPATLVSLSLHLILKVPQRDKGMGMAHLPPIVVQDAL